jgi:type IV secretion system protein TrbL
MRRKQQLSHAASTTAHVLRSGDHGGSGTGPNLRDDST